MLFAHLGLWLAAAIAAASQSSPATPGEEPARAARPAQTTHAHAVALYREHKYGEAIPVLEKLASAEADGSAEYAETVTALGQSLYMTSQNEPAVRWLEKAPKTNEVNYMLGNAYVRTGKPEQAVAAYARLFGVDANSAGGHLLAGQMMLKQEFEPEAVAQVQQALALNPNLPEAHFLLAEVALFRGRPDQGIEELRRELAINPNFSMAYYRLGDAYQRKEACGDAIPQLQRAIWLNPDFSGPYILLGKCYFKLENYENAAGILRRALQVDPQNYSATYLLGQTLFRDGRVEEGRALLEKAKTLQR